uniref:Phospholipid-transporting ATPase n=1 Tax=Denticeps clupeoides TaxID=299321 RepID=A0AAY4CX71_9TELE
EEDRHVRANDREFNEKFSYADNRIKTSKYNIFTFLPINLFEQFQRVANAYFLVLLILQLIPEISSLSWFTTIVPLVLVLAITAIKDATDDFVSSVTSFQPQPRLEVILRNRNVIHYLYKPVRETSGCEGINPLLHPFMWEVICEPPNNKLDRFIGTLYWRDNKYPLDNEKMLLRGCVLRNTEWCFGLVIFAGLQTKLMQNCGRTTFKRTSIDKLMNTLVLWIFAFLICMGIILAVGNTIWEVKVGRNFWAYLLWDELLSNAVLSGFLTFWSYIIILNTVVPISLYVSVEVLRLGHSYFINWDRRMYYSKKDTPAEARTTTLNEELGQVEFIFSDKTGTLTQNIMVFNKCSINGNTYGKHYVSINQHDKTPCVDFSFNPLRDQKFRFHDSSLVEAIKLEEPLVQEFFRLLALCHTVMPEERRELLYQAQSPDEGALVTAARNFGYVFRARTPETITLYEMGQPVTYQLLAILDFNNVRKRMSVVVRNPKGQIKLYSKGADTIIFDRLDPSNEELMYTTSEHLNEFAGEGLRTLALACKDLDEDMFKEWMKKLLSASSILENREEHLGALYEEIEQGMMLLGATAIEDKLQEGVPETIACLTLANIKIWVLTGDKLETAMNIGYSCNMLRDDMNKVFIISDLEKLLLDIACLCKTVICCRVTPLQKAQVVDLVKRHKRAVTLAIGDGANDVSMIKTAHIGVGISGQEGMQAVLASDYSFAQFRFLQRLLLVHGRWSYHRMCNFLCYFFYKNFAFTLVHFWFGFFCGFSAQVSVGTVYDQWFITLFNIVYTSLPVLAMGIFDQDVNEQYSLRYPNLYKPGQTNLLFNKRKFFICTLQGICTSSLLFFIPYGAFLSSVRDDGSNISDQQAFAVTIATSLVIVVSVQIGLDTNYWTAVNHFFIWGSLAMYFAIMFAMTSDGLFSIFPNQFPFIGTARNSLSQKSVWLVILLTTVVCIMPMVVYRFLRTDLRPTLSDKATRRQGPQEQNLKRVRRTSSRRSAYAFAHQQGYGELITSGKNMRVANSAQSVPSLDMKENGSGCTESAQKKNGSTDETIGTAVADSDEKTSGIAHSLKTKPAD